MMATPRSHAGPNSRMNQEDRLRQIYDKASLFALPTRFDCFGIAFVEAMYHRLPCIGSNNLRDPGDNP